MEEDTGEVTRELESEDSFFFLYFLLVNCIGIDAEVYPCGLEGGGGLKEQWMVAKLG